MNLSDLPAGELARLDAVCMEFEETVRCNPSQPPSDLESEIQRLVERHGGEHTTWLRAELVGIRDEILSGSASSDLSPIRSRTSAAASNGNASQPPTHDDAGSAEDATKILDLSTVRTSEIKSEEPNSIGQPTRSQPRSTESSQPGESRSSSELPALGTSLGPYLLTDILGRGGMGIVYRATDQRLDRSVAVKVLAVNSRHGKTLADRFQREAKAVAALSHPNIIELFDIGVHQGLPYAVMEHLRGETLHSRLKPDKVTASPISAVMVRHWGLQLADALAAAHDGGVVHRDLKPENVMLIRKPSRANAGSISASITANDLSPDAGGSLKLFDFGLSRVDASVETPSEVPSNDGEDDSAEDRSDSATRVGMILGTPGYMSPEQARGDVISPSVDVFALGCVLFEAFYGRPAFAGETPARRYAAVLESAAQVDAVRRRDDVELADLISRMLEKSPAARPTASEIVAVLRHGHPTANSTIQAMSPTTPVLSRRRLVELVGGGMAGALLGTLAFRSSGTDLRSIRSIAVLSLMPLGDTYVPGPDGLQRGELLASLLVNELSRLDDLSVPRYTPMVAEQPEDFRNAASQLEVDALITGTYGPAANQEPGFIDVNLQIIAGQTGKVLAGLPIRTHLGSDLVGQTAIAQDIAQQIGRTLMQADDVKQLTQPEAFTCLVKGRTLADPDSTEGLRMALMCFRKAAGEQSSYAPALAGVALTAVTLAARAGADETPELIAEARQMVTDSLAASAENVDAQLANAMLDYQTLGDIDSAKSTLTDLAKRAANQWQVHHQLGWVQLISRNESSAMRELKLAAQLHPMSMLLKADLARADWFRMRESSSIEDLKLLLETASGDAGNDEGHPPSWVYPAGLLIDIHEQGGRLVEAAAIDRELAWKPTDGDGAYFAARAKRLTALPYGPYGEVLNEAILSLRRTDVPSPEPAPTMLARLLQSQSPMLGTLIARHPQFLTLSVSPRAMEEFPFLS
ncbi:MAG: protein kinase [Planctomycetota bacterium]